MKYILVFFFALILSYFVYDFGKFYLNEKGKPSLVDVESAFHANILGFALIKRIFPKEYKNFLANSRTDIKDLQDAKQVIMAGKNLVSGLSIKYKKNLLNVSDEQLNTYLGMQKKMFENTCLLLP